MISLVVFRTVSDSRQASSQRPLIGTVNMAKTPKLTFDDATQVWLMHWSGMYQHDIAAHFGVNQGRNSEILNEHTHPGSEQAARMVA